jgi:hypothetical protein
MWSWISELPATKYDSLVLALISLILGGVWIHHGIVKKQTHAIVFGVGAVIFGACLLFLYAQIVADPVAWGYD